MRALGVSVILVVLAGCAQTPGSSAQAERLQCQLNPSSCMYEGSYEPGEEQYAEQRAKELNRESARKLRRQSSWW